MRACLKHRLALAFLNMQDAGPFHVIIPRARQHPLRVPVLVSHHSRHLKHVSINNIFVCIYHSSLSYMTEHNFVNRQRYMVCITYILPLADKHYKKKKRNGRHKFSNITY